MTYSRYNRSTLYSVAQAGKMRTAALTLVLCALFLGCACGGSPSVSDGKEAGSDEERVRLPRPEMTGGMTLNEALSLCCSVRSFGDEKLTRQQISQLLWAVQGALLSGEGSETATGATRRAPSAGGIYPLEVYMLESGTLFRYDPGTHSLEVTKEGVSGESLAQAALGQPFISEAPAVFIMTAVFERTRSRYGSRGDRYVYIEVGHAAQNLMLEAAALGLGSVPVGAFDDEGVRGVLDLPGDESPVYIVPVGASP